MHMIKTQYSTHTHAHKACVCSSPNKAQSGIEINKSSIPLLASFHAVLVLEQESLPVPGELLSVVDPDF